MSSPERRTARTRLVLDGSILTEIDQTRETLRLARLAETRNPQGLASEVPRLERALVELAEKAATEAMLVVVRALPGEAFDDIKRRHPPSEEQLERYRIQSKTVPWVDVPEMDPVTMGPELFAACLIEPEWDESRVRAFWSELSKGQQIELWNLVYGVQIEGSNLPFFAAATDTTDGGGDPSTTPANGGSPPPGS